MNLALFVDPAAEEFAAAVEAASFVVEAALSLGQPLLLSSTPSAALEIGLSTFEHGIARTVEGGERRPSPIILLPLVRDFEQPDDDRLYESSRQGNPGTIDDLVDLGIIASREESGFDPFDDGDAVESFVRTLRQRRPSKVFGLGLKPRFWTPTLSVLRETTEGRLIVVPDHFPINLVMEPHVIKVRRAEIPDRPTRRADDIDSTEDEFEQAVLEARQQAASIAALIEAALEF